MTAFDRTPAGLLLEICRCTCRFLAHPELWFEHHHRAGTKKQVDNNQKGNYRLRSTTFCSPAEGRSLLSHPPRSGTVLASPAMYTAWILRSSPSMVRANSFSTTSRDLDMRLAVSGVA